MNIYFEKRIVPVVSIKEVQDALPLAEALMAGGLDVLEITFRTPAAESALRSIAKEFPKMLLGAGTLLEPSQLPLAQDAGARFGVAPGLNRMVIEASQRMSFPFIPGVMTPSEVEGGLSLGCKLLKFFPANLAGGIPMLQALAGPYGHTGLKFVVLGGVTTQNMREILDLPIVVAVGGSWLVDPKLIAAKNWDAITSRTKEALEITHQRG
jgi:2-dehydro-3-deoxyphosphogluconate aldolase/(4S)-4-hydroxy-2-oxoglutarate aldolase